MMTTPQARVKTVVKMNRLWNEMDDEFEAMIRLREARNKLQQAQKSRWFYKRSDSGRDIAKPNKLESMQGPFW